MFFTFFIYIIITLSVLLFFCIIIMCLNFLVVFIGAPFIPTDKKKIKTILKFAEAGPGQKIAELGSGDGRLVVALAKTGAEVHGYEINPLLVRWSRYKIKKAGLNKLAFIHQENFWNINLKSFNTIVFFAAGHIMEKLKNKIKTEAKKEVKIISNAFHFNDWQYVKKESQVVLYKFS